MKHKTLLYAYNNYVRQIEGFSFKGKILGSSPNIHDRLPFACKNVIIKFRVLMNLELCYQLWLVTDIYNK